MNKPEVCPECGSVAIVETTRHHTVDGTIHVCMCKECHWISDPPVGRLPADHSKNVTLRRLMADVLQEPEDPEAAKSPTDKP